MQYLSKANVFAATPFRVIPEQRKSWRDRSNVKQFNMSSYYHEINKINQSIAHRSSCAGPSIAFGIWQSSEISKVSPSAIQNWKPNVVLVVEADGYRAECFYSNELKNHV